MGVSEATRSQTIRSLRAARLTGSTPDSRATAPRAANGMARPRSWRSQPAGVAANRLTSPRRG